VATVALELVKLPDCELVMDLPEVKSAAVQVLPCPGLIPVQKKSWIFRGGGELPFGSKEVNKSEKPPL
jgi:hypothetical protein